MAPVYLMWLPGLGKSRRVTLSDNFDHLWPSNPIRKREQTRLSRLHAHTILSTGQRNLPLSFANCA